MKGKDGFNIIWFPVYIGDFTTATTHLSAEQIGIYFLLLLAYYKRRGPLPDDDNKLSLIAKISLRRWKSQRPEIEEFFDISGGVWTNKRAEIEIRGIKRRHDAAVENGRCGGAGKHKT